MENSYSINESLLFTVTDEEALTVYQARIAFLFSLKKRNSRFEKLQAGKTCPKTICHVQVSHSLK